MVINLTILSQRTSHVTHFHLENNVILTEFEHFYFEDDVILTDSKSEH